MIVVTSAKIRRDIRIRLTATYPEFHFRFHTHIDEAEKDLKDADILITYGEDLSDEHIENATHLKWIMVISAGLDEMPFHSIKKKEIIVTNAKGIHSTPMAEYAIGMMLQVSRQTKVVIENEANHKWDRSPKMTELNEKTLGVLGAGAIGKEVARLAKAFNMRVIGMNRSGRKVENFDQMVTKANIDSLLENADYIVSVLPKMDDTNKILARNQFVKMKNNVVLVNMGRGNAIHEKDLLIALKNGELHHAVLDVFNEEPLPEDHPFWGESKITVTPHLSGISPQYQPRAFEIFEHNLKVFLDREGDYINLIDPKKGY
ncbi:D-2-hydroxyacid dehydrogenase [Salipaludibacillus daqingensis]|uniref:D-2-hydroxyacid dehydrogenase n=1 Tax=Salipaludibacillus daqingensis TaxID=3041001 RepID=UPI002473A42F|nr:D-2-hydroxyacid dehydrogenase [Salipaludibacillus daqingensis]